MNTPRVVTDSQQRVVWRWENQEPFGNNPPEENPSGLGEFTFPLRFAGQYFDRETNTAYNGARDYDSGTGRYIQSDPIGLRGGLNTYAYVRSRPIQLRDPTGLDVVITNFPSAPGHIGIGVNTFDTVGHYPVRRSQAIGFCPYVPGVIARDETLQPRSEVNKSRRLVIKTTPAQDALIQQYLERFVEGGESILYSACDQQCTSFVYRALQAGGLPVPESRGILPGPLFNELQDLYGRRGMLLPTISLPPIAPGAQPGDVEDYTYR